MSETDDTDILLLIPPNFFLVPSSGSEGSLLDSSRTVVHKPSCTAQVLGKLVDQVHSLENRLESLELSTNESISSFGRRRKSCETESFDSRSLDRKCFTFPRRRRRKVLNRRDRKRDWSLTSLDSISTTHIPPLKFKDIPDKSSANDTISMDGDISSIVSTPSKKNDKLLLHEIDEFLTKVESYEIPESKIKNETSLSPENVIKATGDYMTRKMDQKMGVDDIKLPSGRIVSSNILDKYIYLVKNNTETTDKPTSSNVRSQYVAEPNEKLALESQKCRPLTNETRSPSSRKLNFMDPKEIQVTSTPKKPQPYSDTFRPSSNKIYDRASKVLEQYKSKNFGSHSQNSMADTSHSMSPKKDEFKMPQMRPFPEAKDGLKLSEFRNKYIDTIDTDLLSLSEMWGEKRDKGDRMENAKLEEEKLKREHCESIIQQLQKKLLEQQEKLAVAVKVDHSKDEAISKLREAWLKLTSSLERAEERHKAALDKMIREVDNFKAVADAAQKKTSHFESELYKALDLAHDYQDKCKQLNLEMQQVRASTESALASKDQLLASKDKEIQALKENYETVMRLNKQSTDCVKNLEDVLEKEKSDHNESKQKIDELSQRLQSIDEETALVHQERDLLRTKINEERGRSTILERQLADKQDQCSDLLNKCDNLDAEVKSLRKQLELQKNELKCHYQKQLEDAVLAKLQEFQQQLEHAERDLENDARGKESAMLETFNRQVARIEEQHKLEIKVLEEKQKEEIKLYRLQLAQASEKIGLLESKLDSHRRRRGQIATQLHGVMQQQWRQAVRILTSGQEPLDHTRDSASTPAPEFAGKVPPLSLPPRRDRDPLNLDGLSDHELQHYVKLLLTKPPALDSTERSASPHEEPTSDRPERRARRGLNHSGPKPPWKA